MLSSASFRKATLTDWYLWYPLDIWNSLQPNYSLYLPLYSFFFCHFQVMTSSSYQQPWFASFKISWLIPIPHPGHPVSCPPHSLFIAPCWAVPALPPLPFPCPCPGSSSCPLLKPVQIAEAFWLSPSDLFQFQPLPVSLTLWPKSTWIVNLPVQVAPLL